MVHDLIDKNLEQLSGGTFGIFKGRNDTRDGGMRIDDGSNDQSLYLSIVEFEGQYSLPQKWWPDVAPTPKGQMLGIQGSIN